MLAGLVYHVFVWMAGAGAVTPGWYLHILAAPLGFAVALGWRHARGDVRPAGLHRLLHCCRLGLSTLHVLRRTAKLGADKHYSLTGASRFIDGRTLSALGHPVFGGLCLVLGALTILVAAGFAVRAWRARERPEMTELSPLQPL